MLKEIVISIQSFFDAYYFIKEHKLWKWIVLPGLLYMLLFAAGFYLFWTSSHLAVNWISKQAGLENWLQMQRSEWLNFFFLMAGMMLHLNLWFFYFSLFKYIFLIIGFPIFAYLSEKTTSIKEGKEVTYEELFKNSGRPIKLALRNALWQIVFLLFLMLLSLIPVVGWITPLIALFLECYYYGFSMMDYSCQRSRMNPYDSIIFISRHKGLPIANGLLFYLMHLVPVLGWVLAPAYAVVASTLSLHRIKTS